MAHRSDADWIQNEHNTARFFAEHRQIAWVVLIAVMAWGVYSYLQMPKRKDPETPITVAAALCAWPGVPAEKVEQVVTRRLEQTISENSHIQRIESTTRNSLAVVLVTLEDGIKDPAKQWADIELKLRAIKDLPEGAGPVTFLSDFGDTAALVLTVATPQASAVEISWRAGQIRTALHAARANLGGNMQDRATVVVCVPLSVSPEVLQHTVDAFIRYAQERGKGRRIIPIQGAGFAGVDGEFGGEKGLMELAGSFALERMRRSELHPDTWQTAFFSDPARIEEALTAVAGSKYSRRELDEYTELIQRTLLGVPLVSKVSRSGVLKERIFLEYSQQRLASYGIQPTNLKNILSGRNISFPGGSLEVEGKGLLIDPSGEFRSEREIGGVIIGATASGAPVYLRDAVQISRGYESPPTLANAYNWRDADGKWHNSPAVTLAIQMRSGQQIAEFGAAVDVALNNVRQHLPEDLILARVSDQAVQVDENISLFMKSLYEAIVLVVVVAFVGFWEWRSALLMALSIPTTLAMTFGFMALLGIDLQQVSIASLIIALGLLVDDPVVAGDAIKRELAAGHSRTIAAWLGPSKLATAIMFATVTNIVAYLPMLMLSGTMGSFIYSLPVVLACSLVASRLVSMTFVPMLGYYLLRPSKKPEPTIEERRSRGFGSLYYRFGNYILQHRYAALGVAMIFLVVGGFAAAGLKSQFFPNDLSYLSYADVWLPEDATIATTADTARRVEQIIQRVSDEYAHAHAGKDGKPKPVLQSLTTFAGGGGPRFWFTVSPELFQANYAQIIIRVADKHDTEHLVGLLQQAVTAEVPGARVDIRQLETGAVGLPVSLRLSGEDAGLLRQYGRQVADILAGLPEADRVRDNWGPETFEVKLRVDPNRANLAGLSNLDVALSSAAGMSGLQVTTLRNGSEQIPVVARLREHERSQPSSLEDLYVYSQAGPEKAPLSLVSTVEYDMSTQRIFRRNQFRTMLISCFPAPGKLPSEVMAKAQPKLAQLAAALPPGYKLDIGGEFEEQAKAFKEISIVLITSVLLIFLALVFQFRSAVKPLIVFAGIPFGMVGALLLLAILGAPFGFMAFLGITSLIGVIVSHVIVLFDFIEEAHERGEPLRQALLDAGIERLRPVLVTVAATVFGLFPLAAHGGPLWEALCYAQIGGLTVATVITLLLVPVIYTIFVEDLKIVKWERPAAHSTAGHGY